jgi:cytochrome c6
VGDAFKAKELMVQQTWRWLWRRLGIAIAIVTLMGWASPAWAAPPSTDGVDATSGTSAQLFEIHCVGCHPNGGNIIRRGKNLKARALQRYGYDDVASIADIITHGKGVMSAYEDRLTGEEIQALAAYVLEQAEAGW